MRSAGGSSYKTTPGKCAITRVPVEDVCVLQKTEPGQSTICIPHTLLLLCGTGNRRIRKVFYCCEYGQWVLASSGRRGGTIKTGIIQS